jgi:peptidoglycan hydrolase-like protein with peptidoglycan-binding domain
MIRSRRLGRQQQLQNASRNAPPLKKGAAGAGVAALQDALVDLGFDLRRSLAQRKPDGIYGDETEAAVRAFQKKFGLASDGEAGTRTLAKIDDLIVSTPGLDEPDPAVVERDRIADRSKPLKFRRNASW